MKSFDFEAVILNNEVYCVHCLPEGYTADHEDVTPIFANSEWDYPPVCCKCNTKHDYMTILHYNRESCMVNVTELISDLKLLYENKGIDEALSRLNTLYLLNHLIEYNCPECNDSFYIHDDAIGLELCCPYCGTHIE